MHTAHDVTATALAALRRSEERLRLALRSGDIGIWEWNIGSGEVIWSVEAAEIVGAPGLTKTSLDVFQALVDEADRAQLTAGIEAALAGTARFSAEFRIHRLSDGARRWLVNKGDVIRDAAGAPVAMIGIVRDVTARKELDLVLQRSRDAALRRAGEVLSWFESSPAVLWIARDPECRFVTGNRAAEGQLGVAPGSNMAIFGENADRMRHMTVWQDGRRLEPSDTPLHRAAQGETVSGVTLRLVFTDGRNVDLYGSAAPLLGADEQPCGAVGIFVDVSTQLRLDQQLQLVADERAQLLIREQRAREAAEAASRAKDEFIAKISHELRTPLNVVFGYVRALETDAVPAKSRNVVFETIRRNIQLQSQLVDDLLDISRSVRGKLSLQIVPTNLGVLLTDVVASLDAPVQRKHITMTFRSAEGPIVVMGDQQRLRQVFSNLLSNATKFTPERGAITVEMTVNEAAAIVKVSDNGIGIKAEFLPHVFDAFVQEERGFANTHGGLGLGLSIAQALVKAHRGTITVTSAGTGHGATFQVTLPLAHATDRSINLMTQDPAV